jgi:hypothetical protein
LNAEKILRSAKFGSQFNQFLVYRIKNKIRMAKNTSILPGEHFEKFITSEVSSGKYSSASTGETIYCLIFERGKYRVMVA